MKQLSYWQVFVTVRTDNGEENNLVVWNEVQSRHERWVKFHQTQQW